MSLVSLDRDNFQSTLSDGGVVVVDCWASWCTPCKTFGPIFERVAGEHPEHTFGKLNAQSEKELVESLGVSHIPTLLLYRDGILLFRQPGNFSEEELRELVSKAASLDMDRLRAQIAARESGESDGGESS